MFHPYPGVVCHPSSHERVLEAAPCLLSFAHCWRFEILGSYRPVTKQPANKLTSGTTESLGRRTSNQLHNPLDPNNSELGESFDMGALGRLPITRMRFIQMDILNLQEFLLKIFEGYMIWGTPTSEKSQQGPVLHGTAC